MDCGAVLRRSNGAPERDPSRSGIRRGASTGADGAARFRARYACPRVWRLLAGGRASGRTRAARVRRRSGVSAVETLILSQSAPAFGSRSSQPWPSSLASISDDRARRKIRRSRTCSPASSRRSPEQARTASKRSSPSPIEAELRTIPEIELIESTSSAGRSLQSPSNYRSFLAGRCARRGLVRRDYAMRSTRLRGEPFPPGCCRTRASNKQWCPVLRPSFAITARDGRVVPPAIMARTAEELQDRLRRSAGDGR